MAFFLIRLAMVAGAVYGTMELGIWESSRHTQELFEGAKREVSPFTKDLMNSFCCWRCEKCDQDVEVKPWRESMVDAWNESVKKTFNTLGVHVPKYFNRFSQDVQQGFDDLVNNSGEWFRVIKFNRGTWEPTIYSFLSPDFCAIMFNENIYWFVNWNKNIATRAEIEEKCIHTKDTVITYNPFLMSMELDNVRIPNVHGRNKVVFTFEAFDENDVRRQYEKLN